MTDKTSQNMNFNVDPNHNANDEFIKGMIHGYIFGGILIGAYLLHKHYVKKTPPLATGE